MSYSFAFTCASKETAIAKVKAERENNSSVDQTVADLVCSAIDNIILKEGAVISVSAQGHHCSNKGDWDHTTHVIDVHPVMIHQ